MSNFGSPQILSPSNRIMSIGGPSIAIGIGSDLRVAGLKYTKAGAAADDLSAWDGTAVIVDGIVRAVS